jgi:hypothetical protein
MQWAQENTLDFIYTTRCVLWGSNNPKYCNKLHKHGIGKRIAQAMGTVPEECKKRMDSLLFSFRRERVFLEEVSRSRIS